MIIGIDLGTTNSVCAYYGTKDDGSQGAILVKNSLGDLLTPSVVALNDAGNAVVGKIAQEIQVLHPERAASVFKRYMDSDRVLTLGKKKFSAISLSALVLSSLRTDAEALLGQSINRAVITVPAYFNDHARKATIEAGKLAGLHVERILNEPTAAAIAYGVHEAQTDTTAIVIDLGGGTFDVSVIERFEGVLEIKSSSGESFLGGEDFTSTMVKNVLTSLNKSFEITEHKFPLLVSRLRQQCEVAKTKLSTMPQFNIRIPDNQGEINESSPAFSFTQDMFDQMTAPVLDRVKVPILRAINDARIQLQDIKQVILVGGATRMPALKKLVSKLFNQEPLSHLNPDQVVAMGAAIQAAIVGRNQTLEDYVVTDVAPHTLGIETMRELGKEHVGGYFSPIINRNSTIPVSETAIYGTVTPYQTEVKVKVYQGESRKVQDNLLLGEFSLKGFPATKDSQSFAVRFTYDLNGILEIEAKILATNHKVVHVIKSNKKSMSEEEVRQALIVMQSLKVSHRDEQVNQYLISRAERIYKEISIEKRDELSQILDTFEHALEGKDTDLIEQLRTELTMFLDFIEHGTDGVDP